MGVAFGAHVKDICRHWIVMNVTAKHAKLLISAIALWFISCAFAWSVELPKKELADLGSQEFRVRESAELELLAWGRQQPEPAMNELLRQSRIADDPEVRERCLRVLRDLVNDEYLREGGEGYLGISMSRLDEFKNIAGDPQPRNVVRVLLVAPDSAAQLAGLQLNDLIAGLDDLTWHEGAAAASLEKRIRSLKPNSTVTLKVVRDDKLIDLKAVLGRRPASANNLLFNDPNFNPESLERAEKEAYFRRWLSRRKLP